LAADQVWFNSHFNKESFLNNLQPFFKLQPDFRPKNLKAQIEPKCHVKYFPIEFKKIDEAVIQFPMQRIEKDANDKSLRIVWPHRWYVFTIDLFLVYASLSIVLKVINFLCFRREFDKNPDLFFRVMFRLVESGVTQFKLNILGETFTDNPPIFKETQTKLKDYITNFGYLSSKEEYYRILHESDIVVSTSDHEFFGVAMYVHM
jgi:glycosyltransferase involved in cell wall biosynthesis